MHDSTRDLYRRILLDPCATVEERLDAFVAVYAHDRAEILEHIKKLHEIVEKRYGS